MLVSSFVDAQESSSPYLFEKQNVIEKISSDLATISRQNHRVTDTFCNCIKDRTIGLQTQC